MRINENDIPNISAECAKCFFIYDLKYGLPCPRCAGVVVRWARLVEAQSGTQARLNRWAGLTQDYDAHLTEGEHRDIVELDKMFALEDSRSRP